MSIRHVCYYWRCLIEVQGITHNTQFKIVARNRIFIRFVVHITERNVSTWSSHQQCLYYMIIKIHTLIVTEHNVFESMYMFLNAEFIFKRLIYYSTLNSWFHNILLLSCLQSDQKFSVHLMIVSNRQVQRVFLIVLYYIHMTVIVIACLSTLPILYSMLLYLSFSWFCLVSHLHKFYSGPSQLHVVYNFRII